MRIQLRPDLSWLWFPYLQVRKLVQLASKISSSANLLGLKNIQVCWNWPTSRWYSSEVGKMANISRNTFSILGTLTPFPHPPSVQVPLAVILWWSVAATENCRSMACRDTRVSFQVAESYVFMLGCIREAGLWTVQCKAVYRKTISLSMCVEKCQEELIQNVSCASFYVVKWLVT